MRFQIRFSSFGLQTRTCDALRNSFMGAVGSRIEPMEEVNKNWRCLSSFFLALDVIRGLSSTTCTCLVRL